MLITLTSIAVIIPTTTLAVGFSLDAIQVDLEKNYNNIVHIDGNSLSILNSENTLIFDVRQQKEFDVSHIKMAIRIDPNMTNEAFIKKFNNQLKGKDIVFYCSVGQRSSLLASRLQPLLLTQGTKEVYNLKGGIFRWHNEQRPLIQNGQPTQFIHPFNPVWGLLIKEKRTIKFLPKKDSIKTSDKHITEH